MVYHHGVEYDVEKLVCSLQSQGHSEGFHNQNMTVLLYILNC